MGYSNYRKIESVVEKFNLDVKCGRFINDIEPVKPGVWLRETLSLADFLPMTSEKAQAERIISPILLEAVRPFGTEISFFSGEDLTIKPANDLAGECDFCLARHPHKTLS